MTDGLVSSITQENLCLNVRLTESVIRHFFPICLVCHLLHTQPMTAHCAVLSSAFVHHTELFLSEGLPRVGNGPTCLRGVISSPPPAAPPLSVGRKGHLRSITQPLTIFPLHAMSWKAFLHLSFSLSFSLYPFLHLSVSPVSPASGIFVSLPHCGCK